MRNPLTVPEKITKKSLASPRQGMLALTPELFEKAHSIAMKCWLERERLAGREASDLSNSCKFTSLFMWVLFGGKLQGNELHQYVLHQTGILDLNKDAMDVQQMKEPHRHDAVFFLNPEHVSSLQSCWPRVRQWITCFQDDI